MTKKKQAFLSLTGLTIMIVLLVGVSYSLTDYSQIPKNNMITTGSLIFDFDNTEAVLKNKYPISYDEMINEEYGNEENNSLIVNFRINGYNSLPNGVNFKITLSLDKEKSGDKLFDDSVIYAQIIPKKLMPGYSVVDFGANEGLTFGSVGKGAPLTGINMGNELSMLIGNVHTAAPDAYQDFEIRIWLDSSKVIVSDTINRDINNRAIDVNDLENNFIAASNEDLGKVVYRTSEFNEMISAIKIKTVNY